MKFYWHLCIKLSSTLAGSIHFNIASKWFTILQASRVTENIDYYPSIHHINPIRSIVILFLYHLCYLTGDTKTTQCSPLPRVPKKLNRHPSITNSSIISTPSGVSVPTCRSSPTYFLLLMSRHRGNVSRQTSIPASRRGYYTIISCVLSKRGAMSQVGPAPFDGTAPRSFRYALVSARDETALSQAEPTDRSRFIVRRRSNSSTSENSRESPPFESPPPRCSRVLRNQLRNTERYTSTMLLRNKYQAPAVGDSRCLRYIWSGFDGAMVLLVLSHSSVVLMSTYPVAWKVLEMLDTIILSK